MCGCSLRATGAATSAAASAAATLTSLTPDIVSYNHYLDFRSWYGPDGAAALSVSGHICGTWAQMVTKRRRRSTLPGCAHHPDCADQPACAAGAMRAVARARVAAFAVLPSLQRQVYDPIESDLATLTALLQLVMVQHLGMGQQGSSTGLLDYWTSAIHNHPRPA